LVRVCFGVLFWFRAYFGFRLKCEKGEKLENYEGFLIVEVSQFIWGCRGYFKVAVSQETLF
jgi:hypothetical protein